MTLSKRQRLIASRLLAGTLLLSSFAAGVKSEQPGDWLNRMALAVQTTSYEGTVLRIRTPKIVFVTSAGFSPGIDFNSLADADGACQTAAADAGLGGTFMAWLSDDDNTQLHHAFAGPPIICWMGVSWPRTSPICSTVIFRRTST